MTKPAIRKGGKHKRLVGLLDRLAGAGEGQKLLERLLHSDDPPQRIAESVAASAAFETLYKQARTRDIGVEGPKEADAAFVGLPDLPAGLPFEAQFRQHFRPRLGKRADGFAAIFDALPRVPRDLLVVETGCLRIPRNWEGDGQSTFMFDALRGTATGCSSRSTSRWKASTPQGAPAARRRISFSTTRSRRCMR
ncbi:MAG: hypothetical protein ACHQIO_09305 [Nevskiales bacterium]